MCSGVCLIMCVCGLCVRACVCVCVCVCVSVRGNTVAHKGNHALERQSLRIGSLLSRSEAVTPSCNHHAPSCSLSALPPPAIVKAMAA